MSDEIKAKVELKDISRKTKRMWEYFRSHTYLCLRLLISAFKNRNSDESIFSINELQDTSVANLQSVLLYKSRPATIYHATTFFTISTEDSIPMFAPALKFHLVGTLFQFHLLSKTWRNMLHNSLKSFNQYFNYQLITLFLSTKNFKICWIKLLLRPKSFYDLTRYRPCK